MNRWPLITAVMATAFSTPLLGDWTKARCDIYPAGSDHASKMIPCTFSQRQGYITITRDDGVVHNLSPVGDAPGNYRDKSGTPVYRNSGLGDRGQIFRLKDESVYVYWDTSALNPPGNKEDNWTAPFSTADYDATARLRCRKISTSEFDSCPAGALRMEGGQASVVVQDMDGVQFTINFMRDYVNATNREAKATLEGDTWIVTIDDKEVYEVPMAFIKGG